MGACDFVIESYGMTAEEAFRDAVNNALYLYGYGGYTGSIAEKTCFEMVDVPMAGTGNANIRLFGNKSKDKWHLK